MKGTYREKLNFLPGEIVVSNNSFEISFYFKGIDNRYNGRLFCIKSDEIEKYIAAYNNNWLKYEVLKQLKTPGQFSLNAEMGMMIFTGNTYLNGISMNQYDLRLETKYEIDAAINDLVIAKERGYELVKLLSKI